MLADFTAAIGADCSDATLISEDFTGGPADILDCGPTISSAGDSCYPAGELEEGFSCTTGDDTLNTVSIPAGAIGNTDPLIGAITFADFTVINFDADVYATGFDIWENSDPSTEIRIFNPAGDLIETLTVNIPVGVQTFFGVYANELIGSIEIEGANDSGELFGNFLFGAECSLSVSEQRLSSVSVFPNPTQNVVSVNLSGSVAQKLSLIDLGGKRVLSVNDSNSLDISSVATGMYLLEISTAEGTVTRKVVKQ